MARAETITLKRADYDALVIRNEELEDLLAARDADDGSRIPHDAALAVMNGTSPCAAFRKHHGMTLRDLSEKTGVAASYLSEIERGLKPGSASVLSRLAGVFGTTIDALVEVD
ncbi:MAG: helix-turn-helix transcriptional regulator [Deltaproteobacteria bacterium]|nr:helix-turn-helix transcriptional regulator [Deltaproteobacteria bacterium]